MDGGGRSPWRIGTSTQMRALDGLRLESDELRASRKRLALAADAERRRIERELHDGVQQQLVALAANLELAAGSVDADPAAAKELLEEMAPRRPAGAGRDAQARAPDLPAAARGGGPGRGAALGGGGCGVPVADRDRPRARPTRPRSRGRSTSAVSTLLERVRPARRWRSRYGAMGERSPSRSSWTATAPTLDSTPLDSRDRVEALGGRLAIRVGARPPDPASRLAARSRDDASRSPPR